MQINDLQMQISDLQMQINDLQMQIGDLQMQISDLQVQIKGLFFCDADLYCFLRLINVDLLNTIHNIKIYNIID